MSKEIGRSSASEALDALDAWCVDGSGLTWYCFDGDWVSQGYVNEDGRHVWMESDHHPLSTPHTDVRTDTPA